MAETALQFVLLGLKETQNRYKGLSSGAKNELQLLNNDLEFMMAFLRDARGIPEKEETFKEIEREIRDVVYDVEDAVDNWLAAAVAEKGKSTIRRKLTLTPSNSNFAREIKSIREDKVKPVLQKLQVGFAFLGNAAAAVAATAVAATAEPPPTRPKKDRFIRRDKVVGLEDEEKKLLGYLLKEAKELDVISIIGMPGLGKTTLAWKIFENSGICFHFPVRIWVNVSQRFNSRDVFLKILREFTSSDMSGLSDEELAQSVRACLAEEKFLLVMDDMWSPEDWKVMQNVLTSSNGLGKVMITSRQQDVGFCAKVSTYPHMLRFFRLDESWELLQLEVFGSDRECPADLNGIGVELANGCCGLPLAVVVLGGILVNLFMTTDGMHHLKKECENVSERLSKSTYKYDELVMYLIELSYNRLPYCLRQCFHYMAVFPEDHVISAWMLTRLWMAEGFIEPMRGINPEEVAKKYLGDLLSRNLLMLDEINSMGEIKTIRVHDMIRRFCRERAMEENFFQEIMANGGGVSKPSLSKVQHVCRLCLHSDLTQFLLAKPRLPRLRSFLCFFKEPVNLDPRYISTIPEAFPLLRVLESTSLKFLQFPARVTKLIHLRYLTLHIDSLIVLPKPLSQLWNLQTLIVGSNSPFITVEANIWKMNRLRHLKTKAAMVLDPKWDGGGDENLQTLSWLAPESCTRKLSERASNLKELGVRGNLATLFENMSMESLGHLEKLKLVNDLVGESEILSSLPQPECFPPNLKSLTLSHTFLRWRHISTLAMIKTLEVLKLKDNAFVGIYWNAMDVCFPNLNLLLIVGTDLVHWEVSPSTFPKLKSLVLKNCENLNEIPTGLAEALEKLDLERLSKSAVDSALRIEVGKKRAQAVEGELRFRFNLSIGPGCGYPFS